MNTATFPKYYRKAGICVQVIDATKTYTIKLVPQVIRPERMTTIWPNKDRLIDTLKEFDEVEETVFNEFEKSFLIQILPEHEQRMKPLTIKQQ